MKFVIIVLLSLSLLSCKNEASHLPPEKMQQVLSDIHLAEAYSMIVTPDSNNRFNNEKNLDSLAVYYGKIFQHHQITKEEFETSLEWYRNHTESLDSIYNNMIPELSKMESINNAR